MTLAERLPFDDAPDPWDLEDVARCRSCGCTEQYACEGGCWWVPDPDGMGDLCSACSPLHEVFAEPGPGGWDE